MINITKLNNKFPYLKIHGSDTSIHTPFSLVNEIIEKLPINWSDQKLTFLDPCCGRGTFLIVIYNKLFEGLKSIIKDEIERRNHIINNQIYGVDINQINVLLSKKYLYNSKNLICADSLEYNFNMKFDVVIGNPPYQPPTKSTSQKMGSGGKIWHKFIEKAFEITYDKSIISMITPSGWRLGNFSKSQIRYVQEKMFENKLLKIKKLDNNTFAGTAGHISIDYWIIEKGIKNKNNIFTEFKYISLNDNGNILEKYFLELQNSECYIQDFIGSRNRKNDHIERKEKGNKEYKYRAINSYAQYKNGVFDWYKNKPFDFDKKKVIITNSVRLSTDGNQLAIYDNGTMSLSAGGLGYAVGSDEEGRKLTNFLNNSKIIKLLCFDKIGEFGYAIPVQTFFKIPKSFVERFNNGEDL